MSEKILVCSYCEDEVESCDWCDKKFRKGKEIICLAGGTRHFCSKKCLSEFLKEEAIPAEVLSMDDE